MTDVAQAQQTEHVRRVAEAARRDLMSAIGMMEAPQVRAAFAEHLPVLEQVARRLEDVP